MFLNTGAISPGTMADDATVGTVAWTNPNNAKVSDNVYAKSIDGSPIHDNEVKIVKADGTIGTTNKADTVTSWATITGGAYVSYGSSTDLWGETWDDTKINDVDFGVVLSATGSVTSHYLKATNFGFAIPSGATINGILVEIKKSAFNGEGWESRVDHIRITVYYTALPTVTTQAASSVAATTATGNGNITVTGGENADQRGIVYSTVTHSDPGNVAPGSSSYSGLVNETGGSFGTGAFTESLTGLTSRTVYYARAYAHNSTGYSYGGEVNFTTLGFTTPGNIYASDNTYATLAATSGILTVEISKDAGASWSAPKTITFGGSDTLETVGAGAIELFGMVLTRADVTDANLRIRLSQGNISQVYKTFGFTTGSDILTGMELKIEGKYASSTLSLDLLEVKIYYGTSVLPVQAGSQAFASDGRKAGEGAGSGTGVLAYYDGSEWIASDTGATVAA